MELKTVPSGLTKLSQCIGETECFTDGASENCLPIVMESLAKQTVLYMTSYQTQMVEELICYWSSSRPLGNQMDYGILPYIDAAVLLTNWSYLAHYPAAQKVSSWPSSSTVNMEQDQNAMLTLCTCPWASNYCRCKPPQGLPIKRSSRPSRPWRILSKQHFINTVEYLMHRPQLCLCEIGCSPVDISLPTGEFIQMCNTNYKYFCLQVKMWKEENPTTPGNQFGPLLFKYTAPISSQKNLLLLQAFLETLNEVTTRHLQKNFRSEDRRTLLCIAYAVF